MSSLSRRLYGIMMMLVPKVGLDAAEHIINLSVAALLADTGFLSLDIGKATPSATALKIILTAEDVETVLLDQM